MGIDGWPQIGESWRCHNRRVVPEHPPEVKEIIDRLLALMRRLQTEGETKALRAELLMVLKKIGELDLDD